MNRSDAQFALDVAIQSAPNGMIVCDEGGTILFANSEIERIFHYAVGELVGVNIDTLVPESSRSAYSDEWKLFWDGPASHPIGFDRILSGRCKDGTNVPVVEIALSVVSREGRRMVVASMMDVGERRDAEGSPRVATDERVNFERVVSDLAARFVNLSPDQVDAAIVDSQRRIVEALDLDRCTLWQLQGEEMVHTHIWARPEFENGPTRVVMANERFPWVLSRVKAGEAVWVTSIDEVPSETDRESLRHFGIRATALVPMMEKGRVVGALSFGSLRSERAWDLERRERLRLVGSVFNQALARKRSEVHLKEALVEVQRLKDKLALENVQLRHEVQALERPRMLVSESPAIRKLLSQVESVAPTNATVLLLVEIGAGKEVFAQTIHEMSKRRNRPLLRFNCAAIPTALIESELFGHERGAYTGAFSQQVGQFELANGATLLLDEVGELSLEAQAKLLRVLQDGQIERLGRSRPIRVDVRVIAATNRDLERAVRDRTFREDLYYRLNVFPITVPPLRERLEDIPVLVWTFIDEFSKTLGKRIDSISLESLEVLSKYSWPGNVRELRNVIERATIVSTGPRLSVDMPRSGPRSAPKGVVPLVDVEIGHIRSVLESAGWRVRGRGGAAELLGMKPTTLDSRMAKLGIYRMK